MAIIGSSHGPYHVNTMRVTVPGGEERVYLECWKKLSNPTRYSLVEHQYMPVLDDQVEHDA